MRALFDTATGGQISTDNEQVLAIEFHARSTNGSSAYVGGSDLGRDHARELPPGESHAVSFNIAGMDAHAGRSLLSEFYVLTEAGDKVDWTAVVL